ESLYFSSSLSIWDRIFSAFFIQAMQMLFHYDLELVPQPVVPIEIGFQGANGQVRLDADRDLVQVVRNPKGKALLFLENTARLNQRPKFKTFHPSILGF